MQLPILQLILLLAASGSSDFNDPELVRKIKDGDKRAFKTFFDAHHNPLYYFLLKKGVSEQVAEDLIQQAFLYIWEHREQIDVDKSLRSYLFRIAYTRMLNVFRDYKKFDSNAEVSNLEASDDADDRLNREELNTAIEEAISSMPEKRKHVFKLCFIQKFTYKEAAEILDVSIKTIENHMGLALKDLRRDLKKFLS